MTYISISPDYTLEIPSEIIKQMNVEPGKKYQVIKLDDMLEIVPYFEIQELRGFLKGIDTNIERDEDRLRIH
ncbi:MAG: AbrB family transcriptional regulator [Ignavibacteria bacterium]|nr:AbrB family transcriptional regulator [Ignavibacteria bacterium]